MSHPVATWPVALATTIDPVGPDVPVAPVQLGSTFGVQSMFGNGITHPFRRDKKNDFAHSDGPALVSSAVTQILGTKATTPFSPGEVPWRGGFGSWLHLLLHSQNNPALFELANHYVIQAINRWEPRVRVKEVDVSSLSADQQNTVIIGVVYDFIDINTGNVVFQDLETRVQIQ